MRDIETIKSELGAARRAAKQTDDALKANCGREPWEPLIEAHRVANGARGALERELREATKREREGAAIPAARESGVCHGPGSDLPEVCQNVSSRIA